MATLEQRYDSLAERVRGLEEELAREKQRVFALECERREWLADRALQQQVIQQAVAQANARSNEYLEENRALKKAYLSELADYARTVKRLNDELAWTKKLISVFETRRGQDGSLDR